MMKTLTESDSHLSSIVQELSHQVDVYEMELQDTSKQVCNLVHLLKQKREEALI